MLLLQLTTVILAVGCTTLQFRDVDIIDYQDYVIDKVVNGDAIVTDFEGYLTFIGWGLSTDYRLALGLYQ